MATPSVNFSDIKIIFCVQGYSLDYKYVVREIGFGLMVLAEVFPSIVR